MDIITDQVDLPHQDLASAWAAIKVADSVRKRLLAQSVLALQLCQKFPVESMHVHGKGRTRPVLFLGQSLVRLPTPAGAQTPTALKMLQAYCAMGSLDPFATGLAAEMNDSMQNILHG